MINRIIKIDTIKADKMTNAISYLIRCQWRLYMCKLPAFHSIGPGITSRSLASENVT
jgi:hypothetical protein